MKIKLVLSTFAILTIFSTVSAQTTFQSVIGAWGISMSNASQITYDKGYIMAGGGLVKTDSIGNLEWIKCYNGTFYAVQQTPTNGYIAAGITNKSGAGGHDIYLVKTDSKGDTLWTKTYGGTSNELAYSIQVTQDSGYVIAGFTESFGAGLSDVYIIRTNSNGDILWTRTIGNNDYECGNAIIKTSDGNFAITGYTKVDVVDRDVILIKLNQNGDTLWTRTYGDFNNENGMDVIQTSDGGYAITGLTVSFAVGGQADVYFIKTDSLGNCEWSKTYGSNYVDEGYIIRQTADDGYIIAGRMQSYDGGGGSCIPFGACYDVYLIRTDEVGDTLWTRMYGGGDIDWAYSLEITADNGFIITGQSDSFGGRAYLIKTDEFGNNPCNQFNTNTIVGNPTTQSSSGFQLSSGGIAKSANGTVTIPYNIEDSILCTTVGLSETSIVLNEFNIYPNPFDDYTTLTFDNPSNKICTLIIYDAQGRIVQTISDIKSEQVIIKRQQLMSGLYFFQVRAGSQLIASGKLAIE